MKLPGVLVITTALAAALAASGPEVAVAGGAHNGGIYPWYRYGYSVPYPYGLAPSATVHVVTGRSVATAPVLPYHLYCAYGYDYPFGCPYWPYWYW